MDTVQCDFALFLQWLAGHCPCPCVCVPAVPGAAQTRAFLAVLQPARAHGSPGSPLCAPGGAAQGRAQPRLASREQRCSERAGPARPGRWKRLLQRSERRRLRAASARSERRSSLRPGRAATATATSPGWQCLLGRKQPGVDSCPSGELLSFQPAP